MHNPLLLQNSERKLINVTEKQVYNRLSTALVIIKFAYCLIWQLSEQKH